MVWSTVVSLMAAGRGSGCIRVSLSSQAQHPAIHTLRYLTRNLSNILVFPQKDLMFQVLKEASSTRKEPACRYFAEYLGCKSS